MKSKSLWFLAGGLFVLVLGIQVGVQMSVPEVGKATADLAPSAWVSPLERLPLTDAALDPDRLAQAQAAVDELVLRLQAGGVTVLGTEIKRAAEPVWVAVKVPREQVSPENLALAQELRRQPAILRRSGLVINYLTVITVENGREAVDSEFLVDDLLPADEWSKAPGMAEADAQQSMAVLVGASAAGMKLPLQAETTWSIRDNRRFAGVTVTLDHSEARAMGRFLDSLDTGVEALNARENAGISQLEISVRGEGGELLAKEIIDYELSLGARCVWINPLVDGPDARPGFMQ